MKLKTIENIINSKFDAFIKSVTDEKIKDLIKKNTIISGGCIASMLLEEKINDYDMYFTNQETCFKVAEYFVEMFKKAQSKKKTIPIFVEEFKNRIMIKVKSSEITSDETKDKDYRYFEAFDPGSPEQERFLNGALSYAKNKQQKQKYKPIFITSNAITLNGDIQLILRFYGDAKKIHENFDYVHATNYWLSSDRKVHTNPKALECLLCKELSYIGSLYPVCSIFRLRKFIKRGFSINAGQLFKIMFQISDLDLNNIEVLYEQLIGVDIAYMEELLCRLRSKENIDYIYICKLIDEIF